jgi:hypothetical protein
MTNTEIKQRITANLNNLNTEELILVEKILTEITSYFQSNQITITLDKSHQNNDDPLAKLRNSDFIGCIEDEPNLAEKSEAIAHQILSQKDVN